MIKTIFGGCGFSCSQEKRSGKRKTKRINFFIGFDLFNDIQIIKISINRGG
jgi:hypothetical protein